MWATLSGLSLVKSIYSNRTPLALIITGVAGTGKSYLINAILTLLSTKCAVTATTGKAAFNINKVHSLKITSCLKRTHRSYKPEFYYITRVFT